MLQKHSSSICFCSICEKTSNWLMTFLVSVIFFQLSKLQMCRFIISLLSFTLVRKFSWLLDDWESQGRGWEKKRDGQERCFSTLFSLHTLSSQYCQPWLCYNECVLRLCIRLRFQRSHTVPCVLVVSPGNKSAQGTLLWEAYGKEHMHVQPWGYITMYNNG